MSNSHPREQHSYSHFVSRTPLWFSTCILEGLTPDWLCRQMSPVLSVTKSLPCWNPNFCVYTWRGHASQAISCCSDLLWAPRGLSLSVNSVTPLPQEEESEKYCGFQPKHPRFRPQESSPRSYPRALASWSVHEDCNNDSSKFLEAYSLFCLFVSVLAV